MTTASLYAEKSLDAFVKAALGRKAQDLVVLDISRLTSIADAFIICSGRSNRQVAAIAEFIHLELKEQGIKPLSIEGMQAGVTDNQCWVYSNKIRFKGHNLLYRLQ